MASPHSRCVYLCHDYGIYSVKIPDDRKNLARQEQDQLELVWNDTTSIDIIMETMGMFTDGRHVYLVGGKYFGLPITYNTNTIHIFNPTQQLSSTPMTSVTTSDYTPMMKPNVFRVQERSYLFSLFQGNRKRPFFSFRSFDPIKKCFHHLNTPKLSIRDPPFTFDVGHFIVLDHIYLFINVSYDYLDKRDCPTWIPFAFSFDTRSSSSTTKWERLDSLCSTFVDQKIPFPFKHNGDTGLSGAFPGNNRILVALVAGKPTAYRVSIDKAGGSLQLKSHRLLIDHYSTLRGIGRHRLSQDTMSHLVDLGEEKFCVIYCSQDAPLLVYTFKINFEIEYHQEKSGPARRSVVILSSKKFRQGTMALRIRRPSSACCTFSSAPPPQLLLPCHENVEVDHSKQPGKQPGKQHGKQRGKQRGRPVKKEDDHEINFEGYGVAYVEDFDQRDLDQQIEDELF